MKTIRPLKTLFFLLLMGAASITHAQTSDTIYFDLAAGNVTITTSTYSGYIYRTIGDVTDSILVSGAHDTLNRYYVYQSQRLYSPDTYPLATGSYYKNTGLVNGTMIIPTYDSIKYNGRPWEEFVTNNDTTPVFIHNKWTELASAAYRQVEPDHIIKLDGNTYYDLTIDNLWATNYLEYTSLGWRPTFGPIYIKEGNNDSKTIIRLKNTSKLTKVFYTRRLRASSSSPHYSGYLKFTSTDGDGATTGSLTLTLPNDPETKEFTPCLIGAGSKTGTTDTLYGFSERQVTGLYFEGGTIYAGLRPANINNVISKPGDVATVIGGNNSYGEIYINGGVLTAVSNSTGAAIGGGGGYSNTFGPAKIVITGGTTYAYANGVYSTQHGRVVPVTAIGGGSTIGTDNVDYSWCGHAEIDITGGTVFARSIGGVAIGGGCSASRGGGNAIVRISGENTHVDAISVGGSIGGEDDVPEGVGIGGGTSGATPASGELININGGYANVTISGGTINATSIGGGNCPNTQGDGGNADVIVTGGNVTLAGKIGGGYSATTLPNRKGGDASIYVTGGRLDCASIGGGDCNLGQPGAVSHPTRAGIQIEGDGLITVKSGYIGGGTNANGAIGKATAYINATHPNTTIQGQFILSNTNSTDTDHCYFIMKAGLIDNTNLNLVVTDTINHVSDTLYPRKTAEGGIVYMNDPLGEVIIKGGTLQKGSGTLGGAVYMTSGSFTLDSVGVIQDCEASINGGAVYLGGGSVTVSGGHLGDEDHPNIAQNGGGIYLHDGTMSVTGGSIGFNTSLMDGGGIYMETGVANASEEGIVERNQAGRYGGGIYLGAGGIMTIQDSARIECNHSADQGGGLHIQDGIFNMTGGIIGGINNVNQQKGNYTTGEQSQGGGIYMGGGKAIISGGSICGNQTDSQGWGGGIFMALTSDTAPADTCILSGGAMIGSETSEDYGNKAMLGGGIYSMGGTIIMEGGTIGYNTATDGGGIYSAGNNAAVYVRANGDTLSYIQYNHASRDGGGIYAAVGDVEFSDGNIQFNSADNYGGGIYIRETGKLRLKGAAKLKKNHVLAGKHGGGVYLQGELIVGDTVPCTITAEDNYAGNESTKNNVYLPYDPDSPVEVLTTHRDVITVIENSVDLNSRVGFSVPHGNVPVIYCERSSDNSSWDYLHNFSTGHSYQYVLFDDANRYRSVHYSNQPDLFDPDHVYLYGFWTDIVKGRTNDPLGYIVDTAAFDPMNISEPKELAYFISYVNGINAAHGHPHLNANARLVADIDMSDFGWVPIGNDSINGDAYTGVFDGNGHTVTGILSLLNDYHLDYGFFGKLNDATVKDLFIKDAVYYIENNDDAPDPVIGGLSGTMGGNTTIQNIEVSSTLRTDSTNVNTVIGGLVATQNGGTIHSSMAIPNMTGHTMGGLVGELAGGNLYNSFTNAKFEHHYNTGTNTYFGGLVGVNNGTVENCYMRLRDAVPNDTLFFGMLVGQNQASGNLKYCYSLETSGEQQYVASKAGTLNYRYYDDNTETPYLYARRDNQVHVVEGDTTYIPDGEPHPDCVAIDKQMLLCLNNWVDENSNSLSIDFSSWRRPTTMIINDDLPILKMSKFDAAASNAGDAYIYYNDVNRMLEDFTEPTQAIWLYKNKVGINGNEGSDAKLYIDEGVTVIQSDASPLRAYVGVTLDNSAGGQGANPTFADSLDIDYTDWHMFATPLVDAPLGIHYTDPETQWASDFNFPGHPNGMPYYHFYDDDSLRGYFPSHRYGTTYDGTSTELETSGGNYYREWDYYTYYEPEYHWINFKRNSNSHWHQNAQTTPIYYTNEDTLVQGRGYLLATREETFLQCYGLLNNEDQVTIPVTRNGYYSPGYNLLGNPYLAYLDFNAFAEDNLSLWGDTVFTPSHDSIIALPITPYYSIIDEDHKGYIYHAVDGSFNPDIAPQYIAPHQGFMILIPENAELDGEGASFNKTMLDIVGDYGHFRNSGTPAYPLVNLFATDNNGNRDVATVELGRPDKGGAPVMRDLRMAKAHVWCHYDNKDWAIAFTQPGLTEAAIRFESYEDGEFTLTWNTHNGEFNYLHLIDNKTGADIDCLTTQEYRFTSSTKDYLSRFRLVFGYTGVEENDGSLTSSEPFAYQSEDELVVTGEGSLQLFDVTGRLLRSEELHGAQSTIAVGDVPTGVYILRLGTTNGMRVQKMVINK